MSSLTTIRNIPKASDKEALTAVEQYAIVAVLQQWAEIEFLIYQEKTQQDE